MIIIYQTGKEFFEDNQGYILSDEIRNQFLYGNAKKSWDVPSCPDHFYLKITDQGKNLFLIRNHPHPLALAGDETLSDQAVEWLDQLPFPFPGIIGSRILTDAFISSWKKTAHSGQFVLKTAMDMMMFTGLGEDNDHIRVCSQKDLETLAGFIIGFQKECFGEDLSIVDAMAKAIEKIGSVYGYFLGEKCVSIVALSRETDHYISLSLAYTMPEYRGKGYIQALMKHCAKIVSEKGKTAILHVDQTNPISNRAYKNAGFVVYAENICYLLTEK